MALLTRFTLLYAAAEGFHTPQTRLRASSGCNTAVSYADTDVDSSSDRMDALQERAVESLRQDALQERAVDALRQKGDTAAVKALQADIEDIVVIIDGVDVDVTEYAREHPGGAAVLRKFHGKDASKAFHAAKHKKPLIAWRPSLRRKAKPVSRVQALHARGLVQVHKVLGLFCLGHTSSASTADLVGGFTAHRSAPCRLPHAYCHYPPKFHAQNASRNR